MTNFINLKNTNTFLPSLIFIHSTKIYFIFECNSDAIKALTLKDKILKNMLKYNIYIKSTNHKSTSLFLKVNSLCVSSDQSTNLRSSAQMPLSQSIHQPNFKAMFVMTHKCKHTVHNLCLTSSDFITFVSIIYFVYATIIF